MATNESMNVNTGSGSDTVEGCLKEDVHVKHYLPAMKAICDNLNNLTTRSFKWQILSETLSYTTGHMARRNAENQNRGLAYRVWTSGNFNPEASSLFGKLLMVTASAVSNVATVETLPIDHQRIYLSLSFLFEQEDKLIIRPELVRELESLEKYKARRTDVVLQPSFDVSPELLGEISKMVPTKLLHIYLWGYVSGSLVWDDALSSDKHGNLNISLGTLKYALELEPYIEEPVSMIMASSGVFSFNLRPQVRHDFILSSRKAVDEYWNTLDFSYAAADSKAALHAFPGSAIPQVWSMFLVCLKWLE
ncbi:hypothetical protein Vadar_025510 [Vaccinium darrowii]|uniref:Uncharacterized protein n=1 Tax=Vaccinium darrowii TaxID=229202 RepID=A0ACB7ZNY1_9ERIC|nr:hypothetical protein Vadar_025510 [Vaccinium darrowii]